jgi:hypothetical protein
MILSASPMYLFGLSGVNLPLYGGIMFINSYINI